jgi:hypothetical protein
MKALLTEDKLSRFATYQKEVLTATSEAVSTATHQQSGTEPEKLPGAMANNDPAAKVAAASKAALDRSGFTQEEVYKLNQVVTSYYARGYAARDAGKKAEEVRARIADAKAKGKPPNPVDTALEKVYSDQLARFEDVRKEFAATYGADAMAVVKEHEPDFFAINEKIIGAAKAGRPRYR